jgi:PHD/YefM family antitoxin component YafN of YafNO toxin-antitoxin module
MYTVRYNSLVMRRVNISTARRELPSLFDRVTERPGEKVTIARRDGGAEAVLVSRSYLEHLEAQRPARATTFKLMSSGTLNAPADEVLAAIRRKDAEVTEARLADLFAKPA